MCVCHNGVLTIVVVVVVFCLVGYVNDLGNGKCGPTQYFGRGGGGMVVVPLIAICSDCCGIRRIVILIIIVVVLIRVVVVGIITTVMICQIWK